MDINSFLKEIKERPIAVYPETDRVELINRTNANRLMIEEDVYDTIGSDEKYYEYSVYFATQHRHFRQLDDALDYAREILNDRVLPIEFYENGKNRFGGEIPRELSRRLTIPTLAKHFGYTADVILPLEFEIHSWSGEYDTARMPVLSLPA